MRRTEMSARENVAGQLLVMDSFLLPAAAFAAGAVRTSVLPTSSGQAFSLEILPTLVLLPLLVAGLALAGCYRPAFAGMAADTYRKFLAGIGIDVLLVGFASYLFNWNLSRMYVLLLALFGLVLGMWGRLILRKLVIGWQQDGRYQDRVLVAGSGDELLHVARTVDGHHPSGYRVVGLLTPDAEVGDALGEFLVVGDLPKAAVCAAEAQASSVIAVSGGVEQADVRAMYLDLEGSPVEMIVYPSLFEVASRRVAIETVADLPLLHVARVELTPLKALAKRTLDLAVAIPMLVLTSPLWLCAAIWIKRDTPGPVLFKQTRVGEDGQEFTVLKFRSMGVDAEARLAELEHLNEADGAFFKIKDDPRVTKSGEFLRKWSIDELPQLWNVIRGDMSMVGPRPPLPSEVAAYEPLQLRRLRARPGLTGPWQVSGRSDVGFDQAVRLDVYYIENWTLAYDLLILLKTAAVVLRRSGAY